MSSIAPAHSRARLEAAAVGSRKVADDPGEPAGETGELSAFCVRSDRGPGALRHGVPWAPQCASRAVGAHGRTTSRAGRIVARDASYRRRHRSQQRDRGRDRPRPRRTRGTPWCCAARRSDRIEALAEEIGGTAVTCDVTVAGVGRRARRGASATRCTCWSTTPAARSASTRSAEADPDDWRRMYDVNVLGLLHVTQALLPALRASGDGLIVNVGSTAGRIAYEGGAGYTAAKHGTQVVTETLRLELVGEPIRISEIAPGMVRTDEFATGPLRRRPGPRPTRCTPAYPTRWSPRTSPTRSPGSPPARRT